MNSVKATRGMEEKVQSGRQFNSASISPQLGHRRPEMVEMVSISSKEASRASLDILEKEEEKISSDVLVMRSESDTNINDEEYRFYSNPNSLTSSIYNLENKNDPHHKVTDAKTLGILIDPRERAVVQKVIPKRPYFLMTVSVIQIILFIVELVVNYQMTGKVIETEPFNYLIGPGVGALIQMGGRCVPCMKSNTLYNTPGITILCPAAGFKTSGNVTLKSISYDICTLSDICGMGGSTNQWWRFIIPIFLHGGLLHLLFNLVFQVKTGFPMEIDFGSWRMAVIYMSTGIGSFIFSGIFSETLSPSTGCSGALYGLIACTILDLTQNWKLSSAPWTQFSLLVFQVVILLFTGTLPFLDNYAHFGGFFIGIIAGFIFIPSLDFGKWDMIRKKFLLYSSIPILVAVFVLLFIGFYNADISQSCTWCKYINCIPGMPWCEEKWASNQVTRASS